MYLRRGDIAMPNTGRQPRVKKKFQWTPYSVTCSSSSTVDELGQLDRLTGYSVPLTMSTRIRPKIRIGEAFFRALKIAKNMLPLAAAETDRADTSPRENTNEPTPTSICHQLVAKRYPCPGSRTKLVPKSSHLPCTLGKSGKSTARMQ